MSGEPASSSSTTGEGRDQSPVERTPTLAESLLRANQELRASIVSNVLTKGAVGLGVGTLLALFVFKRKIPSIMFTTGLGLGMAYAEGSQMVRDYHDKMHREALERASTTNPLRHQSTPPGAAPL